MRHDTNNGALHAPDNALEDRTLQRHFAADPVSWAARTYLSLERLSIE